MELTSPFTDHPTTDPPTGTAALLQINTVMSNADVIIIICACIGLIIFLFCAAGLITSFFRVYRKHKHAHQKDKTADTLRQLDGEKKGFPHDRYYSSEFTIADASMEQAVSSDDAHKVDTDSVVNQYVEELSVFDQVDTSSPVDELGTAVFTSKKDISSLVELNTEVFDPEKDTVDEPGTALFTSQMDISSLVEHSTEIFDPKKDTSLPIDEPSTAEFDPKKDTSSSPVDEPGTAAKKDISSLVELSTEVFDPEKDTVDEPGTALFNSQMGLSSLVELSTDTSLPIDEPNTAEFDPKKDTSSSPVDEPGTAAKKDTSSLVELSTEVFDPEKDTVDEPGTALFNSQMGLSSLVELSTDTSLPIDEPSTAEFDPKKDTSSSPVDEPGTAAKKDISSLVELSTEVLDPEKDTVDEPGTALFNTQMGLSSLVELSTDTSLAIDEPSTAEFDPKKDTSSSPVDKPGTAAKKDSSSLVELSTEVLDPEKDTVDEPGTALFNSQMGLSSLVELSTDTSLAIDEPSTAEFEDTSSSPVDKPGTAAKKDISSLVELSTEVFDPKKDTIDEPGTALLYSQKDISSLFELSTEVFDPKKDTSSPIIDEPTTAEFDPKKDTSSSPVDLSVFEDISSPIVNTSKFTVLDPKDDISPQANAAISEFDRKKEISSLVHKMSTAELSAFDPKDNSSPVDEVNAAELHLFDPKDDSSSVDEVNAAELRLFDPKDISSPVDEASTAELCIFGPKSAVPCNEVSDIDATSEPVMANMKKLPDEELDLAGVKKGIVSHSVFGNESSIAVCDGVLLVDTTAQSGRESWEKSPAEPAVSMWTNFPADVLNATDARSSIASQVPSAAEPPGYLLSKESFNSKLTTTIDSVKYSAKVESEDISDGAKEHGIDTQPSTNSQEIGRQISQRGDLAVPGSLRSISATDHQTRYSGRSVCVSCINLSKADGHFHSSPRSLGRYLSSISRPQTKNTQLASESGKLDRDSSLECYRRSSDVIVVGFPPKQSSGVIVVGETPRASSSMLHTAESDQHESIAVSSVPRVDKEQSRDEEESAFGGDENSNHVDKEQSSTVKDDCTQCKCSHSTLMNLM